MVSHGGVDREDVDYRTTQGVCAQPRPKTNNIKLINILVEFYPYTHSFVCCWSLRCKVKAKVKVLI